MLVYIHQRTLSNNLQLKLGKGSARHGDGEIKRPSRLSHVQDTRVVLEQRRGGVDDYERGVLGLCELDGARAALERLVSHLVRRRVEHGKHGREAHGRIRGRDLDVCAGRAIRHDQLAHGGAHVLRRALRADLEGAVLRGGREVVHVEELLVLEHVPLDGGVANVAVGHARPVLGHHVLHLGRAAQHALQGVQGRLVGAHVRGRAEHRRHDVPPETLDVVQVAEEVFEEGPGLVGVTLGAVAGVDDGQVGFADHLERVKVGVAARRVELGARGPAHVVARREVHVGHPVGQGLVPGLAVGDARPGVVETLVPVQNVAVFVHR
ncbi:hypothetical protein ACKVWC_011599 [Pyricularia oryzae]